MAMTLDEFKVFRDLIYGESGIYFNDNKMYFVDTRLQSRLQAINCSDTREYMEFIKQDKSKAELDQFIDSLTTNETYFFRDMYQLDAFIEETLPPILARKKESRQSTVRIWSAGCSTGEEPYTLAILLRERIKEPGWNFQIIATDISQRVLSACRAGVYPQRSVKDATPDILTKYFSKEGTLYKISPEIKKMVQFSHLNLFNKGFMRAMTNFDVIFCRNVLVYFDKVSAKQVIGCYYDSLNQGGVIYLGFSESMHQFSAAFKTVRYKKAFAYMKE